MTIFIITATAVAMTVLAGTLGYFLNECARELHDTRMRVENYRRWLEDATHACEDKDIAIKAAYARIDKLEDSIKADTSEESDIFMQPTLDDEQELSNLVWTPQDFTEHVIYTGDNNSAEAYGDLYEDGVDC